MSSLLNHERVHILQDYDIDIDTGTIFLMGTQFQWQDDSYTAPGTEYMVADRFIRNLHLLLKSKAQELVIHMQLDGGHTGPMWSIYDAIKTTPLESTILVHGQASSASSLILQAADHRVMQPHSHFLLHYGNINPGGGTTKQAYQSIAWQKREDKAYLRVFAERMQKTEHGEYYQQPLKKIERFLNNQLDKNEDIYLSAFEAMSWGLIDTISEEF